MVDFSGLRLMDGTPIYLQIITHVKRGLVAHSMAQGDEMPSRRALSARLGVNPNTIQKAYRMLEEEGLLTSHAGAKSYLQADPATVQALRGELLGGEISAMIASIKEMGLSKEEALALVAQRWEEAKHDKAEL